MFLLLLSSLLIIDYWLLIIDDDDDYYYVVWLVNTDEHWWCFWIMKHHEQITQHDWQYYGGAIYDILLFIIYNDVIDLHIVIRLWGWAMGIMIRTS